MIEPHVQATPRRLYYKGNNTAARGFERWRERWHVWARDSVSRAALSGTDRIGDSDSNGVVGFQNGRLNGRQRW